MKHGFLEDEEPESGEIIEDEKESTEYYNKSTSFFDNISCEATDPHGERITRSAERKAQFLSQSLISPYLRYFENLLVLVSHLQAIGCYRKR